MLASLPPSFPLSPSPSLSLSLPLSLSLSHFGQEFLQGLVGHASSLLFLPGVRVGHLISQGAQGHVRSLGDVEQLTAVRFHQFSSKQWP